MATQNQLLGIATPVPVGNWQANIPYRKLNIVKFNGTTYIAKKDNSNIQPETTNGWQEVWMGIADKGDMGDIGLYHTMSPSSQTVNISSLQPQGTIPVVGSAVLFPNGDVRQITSASGSTVTLGDVMYSVKGDPGVGNATLSNIDGDSTENGFTQAAVKGVAQAKNYYNLGAYDTYVSNGDGTGTVTRKTGYLILNGNEPWYLNKGGAAPYEFSVNNAVPNSSADSNETVNLKATIPAYTADYLYNNATKGICITSTKRLDIRLTALTVDDLKQELASNNVFIEYPLADSYVSTETVIENQPIHTLNQEGEQWLRNEWEKGLNLFNAILQQGSFNPVNGEIASSSQRVRTSSIGLKSGEYTLSICGRAQAIVLYVYTTLGIFLANESITDWVEQSYLSFTLNENRIVRFAFRTLDESNISPSDINNIMLNAGNHAYPYITYNGKIMREKDLSGIQLFPNGVNPAQTIGGDWEDNGTITTSTGAVLRAYKKL